VTNLEACQSIEYFAEYMRECFCGEEKIVRSITLIIEELSEEFPKYLAVHSSQDTQQASAAHEIQQRERTPNLEFPWRKQQGSVAVLNLKGNLAFEARWTKRAFCATELICDHIIRQPGRLIGKRGCGGCPTGSDGIAWCDPPHTFQVF
jgi:hypothetical protein